MRHIEFRKRVLALKLKEMRPCEVRRQLWEEGNYLTSDPEVLNYLDQEYIQYILAFAAEIQEKHPDVIVNRCPECRAYTIAPLSRQCKVCGHKWHPKG
ncbi:hypothetical protein HYN43_004245 [Mucilaginibacter celer]|uniref:Uncharacterized protein n=1 Tax=Mucilaginibacter celer TaxID=2305508 RepID=A0A494VIB9_9SPHI|nr:hypothetical protein HYN43_004245 [Mucilaginibacter celer]